MAIGDAIRVGDLPLPEGVTTEVDPEDTVVLAQGSAVAAEMEAIEEAEEAEAAEAAADEAAAAGEGGRRRPAARRARRRGRLRLLRPRTGASADLLAVGLGNPGSEYAGTRHNVGADVVALLARRHGERLKPARRERALVAEVRARRQAAGPGVPPDLHERLRAGRGRRSSAASACDDLARLVVVHDELDLPVGRLQVKVGGGLAGHNGLQSIKAHLHSDAFTRVRIGIGKPPGKQQGVDHVLRPPGKRERDGAGRRHRGGGRRGRVHPDRRAWPRPRTASTR